MTLTPKMPTPNGPPAPLQNPSLPDTDQEQDDAGLQLQPARHGRHPQLPPPQQLQQQPMGEDLGNREIPPVAGQPGQLGQGDRSPLLIHQLLQTLREPATPQQQQRVIQLLRSNPPLMTAFIRHRQHQQQQQL